MVCEIPFETLDDLSGKMPNLRQQMMRLMSGEIKGDQDMILLLSKKNAEERLAAFIYNLLPSVWPNAASPLVNSA